MAMGDFLVNVNVNVNAPPGLTPEFFLVKIEKDVECGGDSTTVFG